MLMHRTLPRMPLKPRINTPPVKPAQALQPRHINPHLKLLQTDSTLRRVHAVLLRRLVRKHARASRQRAGRGRPRRGGHAAAPGGRAAVRHDARGDVRLARGLEVREVAGGELVVADGAFVFFCYLPPDRLGLGDGREGAVGVGRDGARGEDGGGAGGQALEGSVGGGGAAGGDWAAGSVG